MCSGAVRTSDKAAGRDLGSAAFADPGLHEVDRK